MHAVPSGSVNQCLYMPIIFGIRRHQLHRFFQILPVEVLATVPVPKQHTTRTPTGPSTLGLLRPETTSESIRWENVDSANVSVKAYQSIYAKLCKHLMQTSHANILCKLCVLYTSFAVALMPPRAIVDLGGSKSGLIPGGLRRT